MPIETGMPICRAVTQSAPSELAWILNLLTQTAPYAVPALAELDDSLLPGVSRLRGPIGERFRHLWKDDGLPGCPELMLAAHSADSVLDPNLVRLFDWLTTSRGQPADQYELLTESPRVRPAIRDRFRRLCESKELRHGYRDLCADVWQLGSDTWERKGRATVVRACAGWQDRIDTGAEIEDLVPPRHPLTRADQLGFEDLFTRRQEFALSPIYFCLSGGHVVDFGDYVHVAVPASDLLPIRKVRDSAYVADRLRVLAEPTRVHVLIQLMSVPSGVTDVARALRISQPTVSGHLKILRDAGLVQPRRLGGRTVYIPSRKRVERLLEDARATLVRWD